MYARKTRTARSDSAPPVHAATSCVLDNNAKTCDLTENMEFPVNMQCNSIRQLPKYGVVAANEPSTETQTKMQNITAMPVFPGGVQLRLSVICHKHQQLTETKLSSEARSFRKQYCNFPTSKCKIKRLQPFLAQNSHNSARFSELKGLHNI